MACICGHAEEEHDTPSGSCAGDDCECAGFEPDEDEDEESE
jgi:hypothetical protein